MTLWEVDETGEGRSLGEYPPAPTDVTLQGHARLDASGALFQHGNTLAPQADFIVRRTGDGTSEVVYSSLDAPIVQFEYTTLVTGP